MAHEKKKGDDELPLFAANETHHQQDSYSTAMQFFWLLVWLINNITVTILNKSAFASVNFPYPYSLTAIHMVCNWVGSELYMHYAKNIESKQLSNSQKKKMFLFSFIFSSNIAIGNISLKYVSVNFNQVMRSLVPGVVMVIGILFQNKTFSRERRTTVIPIVIGVALACFGDLRFTLVGFIATIFCVALAAIKVAASGEVLTGEMKLHPVDLLAKMCPLAFIQLFIAAMLSGELTSLEENLSDLNLTSWLVVIFSGITSFSLNICSLMANKVTSPLTLCIAANVKQVLMIALGTLIFSTPVTFTNAIGILIVILASGRYSQIAYLETNKKSEF